MEETRKEIRSILLANDLLVNPHAAGKQRRTSPLGTPSTKLSPLLLPGDDDNRVAAMVTSHVSGGAPGILHSLEVAETVMEVADMAWEAYDRRRHHRHDSTADVSATDIGKEDATSSSHPLSQQLQEENRRLRAALEGNLALLRSLSELPVVTEECPPDLHAQLVKAVESGNFLTQLEALHRSPKDSADGCFPFKEIRGDDLKSVDIVVYDEAGKPSCWVWVTEELDIDNVEEDSGIDNVNYVVVCQEHIIDGIADFIARCILSNPKSKNLTQDELQRVVAKSLTLMKDASILKKVWRASKLIYSFSTWGIALLTLYRHPVIAKTAAKGITASGKLLMKAF